jgi:hypothetical protein
VVKLDALLPPEAAKAATAATAAAAAAAAAAPRTVHFGEGTKVT